MAEPSSPKVVPSRPSTSDGATPTPSDVPKRAATEPTRPSTSCVCIVGDEDVPPVPMPDPESPSKVAVPAPVLADSSTVDPPPPQPSPIARVEEEELKDVYLAGFKQVEGFFAKLTESLNFYKSKSATLEADIAALKDSKAALEERLKVFEEARDETDKVQAEREKLMQGKAINKVRKLIWSASVRRKPNGSNAPSIATVEAK